MQLADRQQGVRMSTPATSLKESDQSFRLAHSLLISRLISPCIARLEGDSRQLAAWEIALRETVESAINRFKVENLLIPFAPSTLEELTEGINGIYGVEQLKVMLKVRALKVSGRKRELIARLIDADSEGMSRELAALGLSHCSSAGKQLAARFERRKKEAYEAAVAAITAAEYTRAIHEYKRLEDDLGFPKWEFEGAPNPRLLELVMTVKPTILDGCSDAVMTKLRLSMAVQCVSGRHAPKDLLRGLETGIRLDSDTAARMIYFLARHRQDIEAWRGIGITHITHLACSDSCAVCSSLNGREYKVDVAPELPNPDCTNDCGCRCLYQPVLNF